MNQFLFSYEKWLDSRIQNRAVFDSEVDQCCRYNYAKKLGIICVVMERYNISFDSNFGMIETCLILAVLSSSVEVSLMLIEKFNDDLIMWSLQKMEKYRGLSVLHAAVANGHEDIIRAILHKIDKDKHHSLLHAHITGSYYLKKMDVSSLALSLACWAGNTGVIELLIMYGAELDAKDYKEGNTLFHTLCKKGKENAEEAKETFEWILTSQATKVWYCLKKGRELKNWVASDENEMRTYLLLIENADGFTPLTLAGKIGAYEMVQYILNIEYVYRFTMWKFGPQSVRFICDGRS